MRYIKIGDVDIGTGHPAFIIGEIGLNHNGDVNIALKLMEEAKGAGFDMVKFQKRTPDICTPRSQRDVMRETPWGNIRYIEYRRMIELNETDYKLIDEHSKKLDILWTASVWDEPSVDFMGQFDLPAYKIPSACLTDHSLLVKTKNLGGVVILSTGMSTLRQIGQAVEILRPQAILHCTSTYPCPPEDINLKMIPRLREIYPSHVVGYSGHEVSLTQSVAAVALGADIIERHITLDRSMWGSDQAASVEPEGMRILVKRIRRIEASMGDGIKWVTGAEEQAARKLRRVK